MKYLFYCLFPLLIFVSPPVNGQPPKGAKTLKRKFNIQLNRPTPPQSPLSTEICNNDIDDDGNALKDKDDFACYFSSIPADSCYQTKIVWSIYDEELYWVDLETNNYRIINFPGTEIYFDIAWTPDGKLYGIENNSNTIREINPNTGETFHRYTLASSSHSNGLTSDGEGNLYLSTRDGGQWRIQKLDRNNGQITVITNLTAYDPDLQCSGDVVFVNGYLYASCIMNQLAKINVSNGSIQQFVMTGASGINGFGLTTLGDGNLYASAGNRLYKVNPANMQAVLFYTFPTNGTIDGLTSYSEFCSAPICRAAINLSIESPTPYCAETGVSLKATGSGINVPATYTWRLPNGQTRTGDTLTAYTSGTYTARYHTIPDSCGTETFVTLDIGAKPEIALGKDTILCPGVSGILLQPSVTNNTTAFLWQDGSNSPSYVANLPGTYSLQVSNTCGNALDSISVIQGTLPQVFIGADTQLCPGKSMALSNSFISQTGDTLLWSSGQAAVSITISQPGIYWLEASNRCGIVRDSIVILQKDSCICDPLFPEVNVGADKEICEFDTQILTNTLHNSRFIYTWQDGTKRNTYTVTQPGTYWVEVATHCGTIRDTVTVRKKTEECNCTAYFPTAFTPTINGLNDVYRPWSNCLISGEMSIYNRWGNMVYTTTNLQNGWDGLHKGISQPSGVYAYVIRYKFANRNAVSVKKGTFLLLR